MTASNRTVQHAARRRYLGHKACACFAGAAGRAAVHEPLWECRNCQKLHSTTASGG
eukprot:CAMPEP_0171125480 /NCGR_PEP_ID=MMETSP0766_2-20121228/111344_1 /TAXON_ID=439317 /ORGANISM="Gambierdiscus australes, Strain CAWD 149" /LENGTH=55 /DNA_ID=CAMNT_0011588467 /DNA_START=154 /DNA_END=319 /DNA_ORIENTATION=-